jgi:hypothetical protein
MLARQTHYHFSHASKPFCFHLFQLGFEVILELQSFTSASQVSGTTGMKQHAQLVF